MITTRVHQLSPTSNHPSRKVTLISIVNYDKFQYVDNQQPASNHLSQLGLKEHTNKQLLNSRSSKDKDVNNGFKQISDWGEYKILLKDGKKYKKHKWKNEPISEFK